MKPSIFVRFLMIFAFVVTALMSGSVSMAQGRSEQKYKLVDPPQRTEKGKIEVIEFFAYNCPHCAALDPMLQAWIAKLPSDVVVKRVPVIFNAGLKPLAQLYYSLEVMNRLDLHPAVFKAIHEEHQRIFTKPDILDWVDAQGIDRAKFESVFDSFGINSKAERGNQLSNAYNVEGTPSIAVNGKYLTSPSEAGGYQETIDVADLLVKKARAQ